MPTLVSTAEAAAQSPYTHEYVTALVRKGKIKGRKAGGIWLVELESFQEHMQRMKELGTMKHSHRRRAV